MTDSLPPNKQTDDPAVTGATDRNILVPRPVLEQMHAHLTSAYGSYQNRRLRQAILILEHILKLRP